MFVILAIIEMDFEIFTMVPTWVLVNPRLPLPIRFGLH
jgi:hypothetical protein